MGSRIAQHFSVYAVFNRADLRIGHRGVVRKVKTGAIGIHQTTLLLHMVAQHFTQGFVHQMRGRVVAHGGSAFGGIHLGGDCVAYFQGASFECAVVAKHIGLDFLGVADFKQTGVREHRALIAHLATTLGIERCGFQHHHSALPGIQGCGRRAIYVDCYDFCSLRELVVAHEGVSGAGVFQRFVHLELACSAARSLLLSHGGMKACFVDFYTVFAAYIGA